MDLIGIDLHKRESQLCILDAEGGATERRIATSRDRFTAVLGTRSPARILVEASTESEWVACHLESLGHEVVVADPNFAPMYGTRSRRVKTDKRDARTLADPAPTIQMNTHGESSVDWIVRPWVKTEDYWAVYWDLTERIKRRFDQEGISIPFPQRDVHLYRHDAPGGD